MFKPLPFVFAIAAFAIAACAQVAPDTTPIEDCPVPTPADQPPADEFFKQGTRLRPFMLEAADGTKARVHDKWFDTMLELPCSFAAPANDGKQWCLPEATYFIANYFSDSLCAQPVAVVTACEKLPKYGKRTVQDSCYPTIVEYVEFGAALPKDAKLWYTDANTACIEQTVQNDLVVALWIEDAVPWETFVSATMAPMQ